jgi:hypothetical protein
MAGAEALILQGIPPERLNLTRESNRQLLNLSGNAMTTTVVGAAILAALISCSPIFAPAADPVVGTDTKLSKQDMSAHYDQNWKLERTHLEALSPSLASDLTEAIDLASSIRFCRCEGSNSNLRVEFQQCSECGHTSCYECGIKPKHHYQRLSRKILENRASHDQFERFANERFPSRLKLDSLSAAYAAAVSVCDVEPTGMGEFVAAIKRVDDGEYTRVSVRRDKGWSISYESPHARLVLSFRIDRDEIVFRSNSDERQARPVTTEWKLYVWPLSSAPAHSKIRQTLKHPVARLKCSNSWFGGRWEMRIPKVQSFKLEVTGEGEKHLSWEKLQGLEDSATKNRHVWNTLVFQRPDGVRNSSKDDPFGMDRILGSYDLLKDCGTACGSIHVKRRESATSYPRPVFLFLDPSHLGNDSHDSFVFADHHDKLGSAESRDFIASVDASWRPSAGEGPISVECTTDYNWIAVDVVLFQEHALNDLELVYLASKETAALVFNSVCTTPGYPVCWAKFHVGPDVRTKMNLENFKRFEIVKNPVSLSPISWLLRLVGHRLPFKEWQGPLPASSLVERCDACAPKAPSVSWKLVEAKTTSIRPFEDVEEASDYERKISRVQEAATVDILYDEQNSSATLKMSLNVTTQIHKTLAMLPQDAQESAAPPVETDWRLVVDYGHPYAPNDPSIQLKNCQDSPKAEQPPSFRCNLNETQLRSLAWMKAQESDRVSEWTEQEVVEALIRPMNLRLEAKATRKRRIRGGVLADDVGYGQTALALALIDDDFQNLRTAA